MSQDSKKKLSTFKKNIDESEKLLNQINNINAGSEEEIEAEILRQKEERQNNGAKGLAAASHIVSGILVGLGIGYGFDILASSKPWGIIICTPIGFAGGMLNMIRALER